MKKGIKMVALALCVTMTCGLIAGCSNKGQSSEGGKEAGGGKAASNSSGITLVFAQDLDTKESANVAVNQIIDEYEKKSGVNIQFESLPAGDYRTWLTTQFSAGKGPDVYTGILYDLSSDYNSDWIYNFADLYEKESPYDKGHKWKETLPDYILKRMYITDKDVPGYPSSTNVVRIFCNTTLFEKAGAKIPTTWAEFMDSCKKLKQSGVTPFGFPNASIADFSWLWFNNSISSQLNNELVTKLDVSKNGYVELNEIAKGMDEGKINFNSPNLSQGFKLMKDFSQYWTSDYNGLDQKSAIEMFIRGEVGMVQAMSTNLSEIDQVASKDFKYQVIPVPTITSETSSYAAGKSVILGGQPDIIYAINKGLQQDEKKLAAAIDFSQYMSSPEVQEKLAKTIYRIPLATSTKLPENLKGFIITEEPLRLAYYTGINEKLRNYFHRAGQQYLEGSIDVNEFSNILNKSYTEVLGEVKTENGWNAGNNYKIK